MQQAAGYIKTHDVVPVLRHVGIEQSSGSRTTALWLMRATVAHVNLSQ